MTDDPRLAMLLDELLDSQRTPEQVCASCPELLPLVRSRWRQMRRVSAQLDALFPPSSDDAASFIRRHADEPAINRPIANRLILAEPKQHVHQLACALDLDRGRGSLFRRRIVDVFAAIYPLELPARLPGSLLPPRGEGCEQSRVRE